MKSKVNKILHHFYIIVCHLYITIKISNLHNNMWQMKKVLKTFVLKIDGGSSSSILMFLDYDTWHNTNMPHGIQKFRSK